MLQQDVDWLAIGCWLDCKLILIGLQLHVDWIAGGC